MMHDEMETGKQEKVSLRLGVWRYVPPIPCPICSAPTIPMWDESYKDEFGQRLWLRACPECENVFTPEPELKLIKGLPIVREGRE